MQAEGRVGRRVVVGLMGVLTASGLWGAGCAEEKDKDSVQEVVGRVESIDLARKTVMVRTYLEKREAYETFPVEVTDETEILINGALAKLEDVRPDEHAEGRIRIVREASGLRFIALNVRLDRSEVLTAPGAKDKTGVSTDKGTADTEAAADTSGIAGGAEPGE